MPCRQVQVVLHPISYLYLLCCAWPQARSRLRHAYKQLSGTVFHVIRNEHDLLVTRSSLLQTRVVNYSRLQIEPTRRSIYDHKLSDPRHGVFCVRQRAESAATAQGSSCSTPALFPSTSDPRIRPISTSSSAISLPTKRSNSCRV